MGTVDLVCELEDISLEDFITKCSGSTGNLEIDQAAVVLGKQIADIPDGMESNIYENGLIRNTKKLPCFRISFNTEFSDPGLLTIYKLLTIHKSMRDIVDISHTFVDNMDLLQQLTSEQNSDF
ncbi:hypothetical protein QAD02_000703 [Eretmocerus hayati]|uniref:Uncharacterized protein n=1 Tax=Eretmocerus hayati TaxID=131215 RepID=A0ACC2NDZ1_9HYME|nr:hypothetical protein QAD02_000703 [Eretmocerus hayati]